MREKLETLSVSVLRDFAKDKKIKNISAMRKSELIDAIIAAEENESTVGYTDNEATVNTVTERTVNNSETANTNNEVINNTNNNEAVNNNHRQHQNERYEKRPYQERQYQERTYQEHTVNEGKASYDEAKEPEMADGILEVLQEGYGFIRCENFLPGENDVYVAPSQIRRFNLKTGDIIRGPKKAKTQAEKFSAIMYVESVNGLNPVVAQRRKAFETLTPIFPNERIHLERNSNTIAMRMVDLISPIGKGQRGMIVSQPKSGKTTLLKQIANAVTKNTPEMHLMILLIDERPEEVTDIKESITGDNVEVIYSTFDELPERHKRVSEMVIERAKRLVEQKQDVIILLDSITRLARAYNMTVQASGRTLSGGLDPAALHMPKRFFGAARNMREGGSLTILATALVETGSKMDDVVFEEFKGTGNMELVLDRKLSEKRVFPAIDIAKSGTRREDLLLDKEELEAVDIMRKALNSLKTDEAAERILDLFTKTRNNDEFVKTIIKNRYV
uniref:transcription termination factor Rho n=1 Tax=[Lactobacillus] rogosae TaxID=706562 RepID=UPI003FED74A9